MQQGLNNLLKYQLPVLPLVFLALVPFLNQCVSGSNPEDRFAQSEGLAALTLQTPVAQSDRFSFMAVGDTHLKGDTSRIKRILDSGTSRGSEFFVVLGDIVDRGAWDSYAPLKDLLTTEGWWGKFFSVLGNHDIVEDSWTHYKAMFGPNHYSFDVGNSRFLVLDTADGTIGDRQWEWLEAELDKTRPANTFILSHYMPVVPDVNTYLKLSNSEEAAKMLGLCTRKQVTAVLGGHYHSYTARTLGGTRYIVAGGGGGRTMEPVRSHFYVEVRVNGNSIEEEMIPVE
jgi:predicted phosphodiesterase